ncbi:MAG: rhodanese-like domain-containing protein [Methylophilaceae bacterium]
MSSQGQNLHELQATSFGEAAEPMSPAMMLALQANFGSVEHWRAEWVALAATRTPARTPANHPDSRVLTLAFEPRDGTLVHRWDDSGVPILAIDLRTHATAEIDVLAERIRWVSVYERYQLAVHNASEPFGADPDQLGGALVLDVRRAGVFGSAVSLLPGARWRDPGSVGAWAGELPRDRPVVVYCVYGHEVGRATALRLRAHGVPAHFLRGGIDAWQAAGRPTEPKGAAS